MWTRLAGRVLGCVRDRVSDLDRKIKYGVIASAIYPKSLVNGDLVFFLAYHSVRMSGIAHIIWSSGRPIQAILYSTTLAALTIIGAAVTNKTVRPDPVDVLHSATALLSHDLLAASVLKALICCEVTVEFRCL